MATGYPTVSFQASLPDSALRLATSDLQGLRGADLSGAILRGATFHTTDLSDTFLFSADLSQSSNWEDATWTGARYTLNASNAPDT